MRAVHAACARQVQPAPDRARGLRPHRRRSPPRGGTSAWSRTGSSGACPRARGARASRAWHPRTRSRRASRRRDRGHAQPPADTRWHRRPPGAASTTTRRRVRASLRRSPARPDRDGDRGSMPGVPASVPGPPILETARCENPWRCSYEHSESSSAARGKTVAANSTATELVALIGLPRRAAMSSILQHLRSLAGVVMQIIGRAALVETLTAHALAGHAVLVYGPRGIGASTLLDACEARLGTVPHRSIRIERLASYADLMEPLARAYTEATRTSKAQLRSRIEQDPAALLVDRVE